MAKKEEIPVYEETTAVSETPSYEETTAIVDNDEKKKSFSPAPVNEGSTSSASTLSMDVLKPQNNPKTPDLTGIGAYKAPENLQDFNKPQETERVDAIASKRAVFPNLHPASVAAQENPSRDTHFLLGNEYLKSGDYEQAIMSFDEAANFPQKETSAILQDQAFKQQVASNDDALAYGIGTAYQKLGKVDDAKRMYQVALEKNPDNPEAKTALAWNAFEEGDKEAAKKYSQEARISYEKRIPAQPEKVGESEYELDRASKANLIVKAAEGIILGDDEAMSLISPVAFGRGFVKGGVDLVKGFGEDMLEAVRLADDFQKKSIAGEVTTEDFLLPFAKVVEGGIKGGFAYLQATKPEVFAAWHLGNATGEALLPEQIVRTIMTPATEIIGNPNNNKLRQGVVNILDTFGNLVIFHKLTGLVKPNELARKIKNNEALTPDEAKVFVEAVEAVKPEEIKQAVSKTKADEDLSKRKDELNQQISEGEKALEQIPRGGGTPEERINNDLLRKRLELAIKEAEAELTTIIENEHKEIESEGKTNLEQQVGIKPEKVEPSKVGEGAEKTTDYKVGDTIMWDVFGNEESGEWIVGEKTKTRGGKDAVALTKTYVTGWEDGKTYTKEYADKNGIKYKDEHTVEHIVPTEDLKQEVKPKPEKVEPSKVGEGAIKEEQVGVEKILNISTEEANVLSMLHESKTLTPDEKRILYKQYKSGVMSDKDVSKYTNIDLADLQNGNTKWVQVLLDKTKGKEIQAEDIDFEEIPNTLSKEQPKAEPPKSAEKKSLSEDEQHELANLEFQSEALKGKLPADKQARLDELKAASESNKETPVVAEKVAEEKPVSKSEASKDDEKGKAEIDNLLSDANNLRKAKTKEEIEAALIKASGETTIGKALDNLGFLVNGIKAKFYAKDYSFVKDIADEIEKIQQKQVDKINKKYEKPPVSEQETARIEEEKQTSPPDTYTEKRTENVQKVKLGQIEYELTIDEKGKAHYKNTETGKELPDTTDRYYRAEEQRRKSGQVEKETPVEQEPQETPIAPEVAPPSKAKDILEDADETENVKDDKEAIKKIETDKDIFKAEKSPAMIEKRYKGNSDRLKKALDEKKISKSTFNKVKKQLDEIYEGKKDQTAKDKEAFKDALKVGIKDALGIKPGDRTTKAGLFDSNRLIDEAVDMASTLLDAVDEAGAKMFELKEAVQKVIDYLKTNKNYKKLFDDKVVDEEVLRKQLEDKFTGKKAEEPPPAEPTKPSSENGSGEESNLVGITKEIMKPERVELGLTDADKLYVSKDRKVQWDRVLQKIGLGEIVPRDVIHQIISGEKEPSSYDTLTLLYEKTRLKIAHAELSKQIAEAGDNDLLKTGLELQKEGIENQQRELLTAIDLVGSKGGDLLQSMQSLSSNDFDYVTIERDISNAQGKPLSKEQQEKFRKLAEEHAQLKQQLADLYNQIKKQDEERAAKETESRKQFEQDMIAKIKLDLAGKKPKSERKSSLSPSEEARVKELRKKFFAFNDISRMVTLLADKEFYEYQRLIFKRALGDFKEFSKELISTVGEAIKEHLPKLFKDAGGTDEQIAMAKKSQEDINGEFAKLAEKIGVDAEGELHEGLLTTLNKMVRNRVENGFDNINDVVNSIHEAIKEHIQGLTKTELRDLITGYGKFRKLSPDEVLRKIAEIKLQGRLDAKVEATERDELPLRNGFERAQKTQDTREKEALIAKNIREKQLVPPLTEEEMASQYKTREQAHHRMLENAIADVEKEIETGKKKAKAEKREYDDERSKELQADLDRLKKIRDDKFKAEEKSAAQKKIDSLRAQIDKIVQGKYESKGTDNNFTDAEKEEIKSLQDELAQEKAKAGLFSSKELPDVEISAEEKKLNSLQQKLDDIYAGAVKENSDKIPDSKAVKKLKDDIEKAKEEMGLKAAKPMPGDAAIEATKRAIKDLEKTIKNLEQGKTEDGKPVKFVIKDGKKIFTYGKEKSTPSVESERLRELKGQKEALQQEVSNLMPDAVKNKAIIEKNRKARERRLIQLEALIEKGKKDPSVYGKKPKPEPKPFDAETKAINEKIKRLEYVVEDEKNRIKRNNAGIVEKTAHGLSLLHRFSIFANPKGILKLVYAALFRPVEKPMSEISKFILSNIPGTKEIFQKASSQYTPTLKDVGKSMKSYYAALVAKETFQYAVSEYGKRSKWDIFHGDKKEESFFDNKVSHVLELPQKTHGFLKTFPKMAELKSAYEKTLTNWSSEINPTTGELYDITNPEVQQAAMRIAEVDALTDIFMDKSVVSEITKQAIKNAVESESVFVQFFGILAQQEMPVIKIPANFLAETFHKIPIIGVTEALFKLSRSGEKGTDRYRGVENLTPEQAQKVSRILTHQLVGLMFISAGMALYKEFGDDLIEEVDKAEYWLHNTGARLFMMGMEMAKGKQQGEENLEAFGGNTVKAIMESVNEMPQIKAAVDVARVVPPMQKLDFKNASKKAAQMAGALLIPQGAAELAKAMDENKKRDPKTFAEIMEMRIPGMRDLVHLKGADVPEEAKPLFEEHGIELHGFNPSTNKEGEKGTSIKDVRVTLSEKQIEKVDKSVREFVTKEIADRVNKPSYVEKVDNYGGTYKVSKTISKKAKLDGLSTETLKSEIENIYERAREVSLMKLGYATSELIKQGHHQNKLRQQEKKKELKSNK